VLTLSLVEYSTNDVPFASRNPALRPDAFYCATQSTTNMKWIREGLIDCMVICLQCFSHLTKTVHLVNKASSLLIHRWQQVPQQQQHVLLHAQLQLRGRLQDVLWTERIPDVKSVIVNSTPTYKPCHTFREHHITMKSSDVLTVAGRCRRCTMVS